jgi:hypothetical protein
MHCNDSNKSAVLSYDATSGMRWASYCLLTVRVSCTRHFETIDVYRYRPSNLQFQSAYAWPAMYKLHSSAQAGDVNSGRCYSTKKQSGTQFVYTVQAAWMTKSNRKYDVHRWLGIASITCSSYINWQSSHSNCWQCTHQCQDTSTTDRMEYSNKAMLSSSSTLSVKIVSTCSSSSKTVA